MSEKLKKNETKKWLWPITIPLGFLRQIIFGPDKK
jgi:hypothetical protein